MAFLINCFIVVISIIVFVISFLLFKQAAGSLSLLKLNTVSYVFYFQIIISAFIGSVIVALNLADYHYMVSLVENKYKIWAWIGVLYSMIVMPISMNLLNILFKVDSKSSLNKSIEGDMEYTIGPTLSNLILLLMFVHSIIILVYVLSSNKHIPLVTLLQGDIEQAAIERVYVRRNFGGIIYIKNLLGLILMPIFSYFSFLMWQKNKSILRFSLFIMINFATVFLLTYDIQKAPVVFFLFGYVILLTFIRGGISKRTFILFVSFGLLMILLGYYLTGEGGVTQFLDIKSAFYGRLFISGYGGYLLSLKLFPNIITQPLWYIGIPGFILDFFNLPNIESARLLAIYINPEGVAAGTANLVSSYYLGEAYANYGILGLLIAPVIVGVVIQSVHIILLKSKKTPLILSFYAFITVKWLLNAGFVNFLYLKIVLFPFLLYLITRCIIKLLANKRIEVR